MRGLWRSYVHELLRGFVAMLCRHRGTGKGNETTRTGRRRRGGFLMTQVVKVLSYCPGEMKVIVKDERTMTYSPSEIVDILDIVAQSEEPTAAMFLAMTDSLIARGEKVKAGQAATMVIKLSGGNREVLLTLFVMLYKAEMIELAKVAIASMDETILSQIDEFIDPKHKVSGLRGLMNYFDLNKRVEKGRQGGGQ